MLAWRSFGAGLVLALLLPACGDDMPPPPPADTGPGRDIGLPDTGTPPDGGGDTGLDGSPTDSSVTDSGVPVTGDCRITDTVDIHTESGAGFADVQMSAGAGVDGFMVGYTVSRGGQDDFFVRHVPTTGTTAGAEQNVSNLSDGMASGGAVVGLGTGWLMLWSDTRLLPGDTLRGYNVHASTASAGGSSPTAPVAVTTEVDVRNTRPSVQMTADGYLVVWNRRESGASAVNEAYSITLDSTGSASGSPSAVPGMTGMSGKVALGALTDGVAGAWVEDVDSSGTMRAVEVVAMDRDGTTRGSSTTVTTMPNAAGTVDYAGAVTGGGVVYDYRVSGARFDVRFRAIDADAATATEPRSVIPLREQGRAPSIGLLGGNALVAYRGIDADDVAAVHLVVVDGSGNEISRTTAGTLNQWLNGETHVLVAPAGDAMVVWNDVEGGNWIVRGARIDCTEEMP
jgi:hypothetical protein